MKPSDIVDGLKKSAVWLSHLNSTFDMFSAFIGKEPAEKAGPAIQGIYGIFGLADERALAIELEKLEKSIPGSREAIAGFFAWEFKSGTYVEYLLKLYSMSKLRVFIAKMGSTVGHPDGTLETITKTEDQGSTATTTIKKELRGKGVNNTQSFLKMMAKTIMKDPQDEEPKYLPGYEKLLHMFKAFGYPYMPDGTAQTIADAEKYFKKHQRKMRRNLIRVVVSLEEHAERASEHANRSGIRRFIRNL